MSWDIYVTALPADAQTLADVPLDFKASSFRRSEIVQRIREFSPSAHFPDPVYGHIPGDGFSIWINLGTDEWLEGFFLNVRGSDQAVSVIADLLDHLELRGIVDDQFFDREKSVESLRAWRDWRDQNAESYRSEP